MFTLEKLGTRQSKIIGLTGGSGSGKSTVAAALGQLGAFVIDCDKIAHENMLIGGTAYKPIIKHFGEGILLPNGQINRRLLGGIVFNDETELAQLNLISHKYITERVTELLKSTDADIAVIDAALLYEVGLDKICDEVWVTDAPKDVRIKRIIERDGITAAEAESRLQSQNECKSWDKKIITDFDTLDELNDFVKELL